MASRTELLARLKPVPRHERTAAMISCGLLVLMFGAFSGLCIGLQVLVSFAVSPVWAFASMFFAIALGLPHILVILWLDRNEPEPWWLLGMAWAWGAVMATGLSIVGNTLFGAVAGGVVGDPELAAQLTASLSAPPVEEITKGAALVVLYLFFRSHFDNVLDGIVYGAMIGMGFAMIENFVYYMGPILEGADDAAFGWAALVILRGVITGIGTHWVFTAITGAGLGLHRVLRRGCLRVAVPILALLLAIFAHFAWNTFAGLFTAPPTDPLMFILTLPFAVVALQVPFLVLVVVVATVSSWHEGLLIRRYLKDERRGIVHEGEIDRLFPPRRRFAHALYLVLTGRWGQWWRQRRRNRLLVQLAFERWHMDKEDDGSADGGEAGPHARRVIDLRRQLRESG
jgi:protease PrsW